MSDGVGEGVEKAEWMEVRVIARDFQFICEKSENCFFDHLSKL